MKLSFTPFMLQQFEAGRLMGYVAPMDTQPEPGAKLEQLQPTMWHDVNKLPIRVFYKCPYYMGQKFRAFQVNGEITDVTPKRIEDIAPGLLIIALSLHVFVEGDWCWELGIQKG